MESLQPLRQAFERHADTIEPRTVCTTRSGRARLTVKAQLRPRVDLIPNNNQRPSYVWQPSHPNAQDSRDIGRTVNRHPTLSIPKAAASQLEAFAWKPDGILTTPVTLNGSVYEARRQWIPALTLEVVNGACTHTWTVSALDADASPVTTAAGSAEDGVDKAVAVAGDEAVTVKCLAADGREILAFAVPVQTPIAA